MTPSEKAKDLVHIFYYKLPNNGYLFEGINSASSRYNEAIMCALVTVDEIIELLEDNGLTFTEYHDRTTILYYLQVKQEINKIYDNRNATKNPIEHG